MNGNGTIDDFVCLFRTKRPKCGTSSKDRTASAFMLEASPDFAAINRIDLF